MAKIEKMFGAILKDQEQKSDELRDKIHAENKLKKEELRNLPNAKKPKSNSPTEKEAPDPLMQTRSFLYPFFSSVKRERACPRLHQAQRV